LKLLVSFAEYSLFYRAFLRKRPIIFRSLLIVATPYSYIVMPWECGIPSVTSDTWFLGCLCWFVIKQRSSTDLYSLPFDVCWWTHLEYRMSLWSMSQGYCLSQGHCVAARCGAAMSYDPFVVSRIPLKMPHLRNPPNRETQISRYKLKLHRHLTLNLYWDPEESEFLDLVDFGGVAFSVENVVVLHCDAMGGGLSGIARASHRAAYVSWYDTRNVVLPQHFYIYVARCNVAVLIIYGRQKMPGTWYGVATISRLLEVIGLFCRILSVL